MSREFYNYKRNIISTAKDFLYPESIIEQLQNATTEKEMSRIMTNARKGERIKCR